MLTKKSDLEKRQLPSVFTNVIPHGVNLQYDSLELCKKNAKLRHSLNEIYVLSFDTVIKLIDDVRVHIGSLYKVCEGIAMLDMVCHLKHLTEFSLLLSRTLQVSLRWVDWMVIILMIVRPEFSDTLAIRKGRYPLMPGQEFVANDAYASQTCRFQIITGPNMSGKSTYLRQIALLSIMAQIGSL